MRYLSVCAGIEAATVAWHQLGWTPVAFSEIDPFPCAVLAHHYPSVPNWGDLTRYQDWPDAALDLLVGGTPCQSFSVAGLRKGLDDPRGSLMLVYLALARRARPRWLVWENVPGVLSADDGRAFGSLLGGLAELGYGFAYRVLDAVNFGCAFPRPRVFVVACVGDWRRAAAVLFQRECFKRNRAQVDQGLQVGTAPVLTRLGAMAYDDRTPCILEPYGPRRATPLEWERGLGFPDGYTAIAKQAMQEMRIVADGPRYKALGNSMAVPVMRWIGERIQMVDSLDSQDPAQERG